MLAYRLQPLFFFISCLLGSTFNMYAQHAQQKITPGLFIENKGQWAPNVLFRSELPGGQLYIEKDRFLFNFQEAGARNHHGNGHSETDTQAGIATGEQHPIVKPGPLRAHAYEVRFINGNTSALASGQSPAPYQCNYFKGSDKRRWASNVNSYQTTLLQQIYPGTDLKCFGKETGFKYEFHLQPGADPSVIKLQYKGVDSIYIEKGELHILTSVNHIVEQRPFTYQIINNQNIEVGCGFRLQNGILSFSFPQGYDKKYPLVIDPQLVFSTYTGSTSDNWGNTATYDDDGNAYVAGIVFGAGYPATLGAYQTNYKGDASDQDPDLGIMKFNPTGTLIYATYLGGELCDIPSSLVVNHQNQLIILGITGSTDTADGFTYIPFPTTTGAYSQTFNGGPTWYPMGSNEPLYFYYGSDLFISVLSPDGSSLVASTFLGGTANDGLSHQYDALSRNYGDQLRGEIAIDDMDNIYIAHKTASTDITDNTVSGYDKSYNGGLDGYVAKLTGDLKTKLWDTYLGGNGYDATYSLQVKSDYSVFVCGGTNSQNFATTPNVLKNTHGLGDTDGFISHLNSTGATLLQSTYVGTASYDQAFFIQLDSDENVYVLGQTLGSYPMTTGVYGNPSTGQFIQKLDPLLSISLMSTTFGYGRSQINIVPTAFSVNDCGNIMLSGWGGDVNFDGGYLGGKTFNMPITPDAYQNTTDGSDFYIMVLKKNATDLLYATYFGGKGEGDHVDGGTSRFDKRGIIYQAVCASCFLGATNTSDFPTTPGAHATYKGAYNCNNAIFKFDLTNINAAFIADTVSCVPFDVTFTNKSTGGRAFHWDLGDQTSEDGFGPIKHTYTKPGSYTVQLIVTDLTTCIGKDTAEKTITVYPLPDSGLNLKDTTLCKGDTIQLLTSCNSYYTYQWSPATNVIHPELCSAQFHPLIQSDYYLTVTDTNSCVKKDTVTIHVAELIKGIGWENVTQCQGKPTIRVFNPSTGPIHYLWTFGDGSSSTDGVPVHEYPTGGTYPIVVDIYNDHCSLQDGISVSLTDVKIPNLITPNGDQHNDCYEIKGLYNNWNVEIYNAWNKRIFKNEQYANDFCGDGLSEGVYYYLVCPPYGDCCKGWLHIVDKK